MASGLRLVLARHPQRSPAVIEPHPKLLAEARAAWNGRAALGQALTAFLCEDVAHVHIEATDD
ncbi:hypothetical protein P3T36_007639 [Kitasatospora sp. MAP12-15]|uniref:hypothetical protein n=1 Tax=unclassified Kitasatospora TaxID=2633591 RepID=UPI002476FB52|nr:hypothetical protein [Kitasatospora sp. MAP12-44]MDH6108050.1 hypothetical protein [Kitasatospora sp. MAP12-44]